MRRMRFILLLLSIVLALMPTGMAEETNLLVNPGFEELGSDGLPSGWYTDAYVAQAGYTTYAVSDEAREGQHSAVVNNIGMNDARFVQRVRVEPESLYRLSGWIKVEDMVDSGRGANLSIEGVYVFSESVYDADGQWHYVELYGETGEDQKEVIVFARVGGYGGESQGKACFDGLSLVKVNEIPGDAVASLWFKDETPVIAPVDTGEEDTAAPFWPWLLVLSAAYLAAGILCLRSLTAGEHSLQPQRRSSSWVFWCGMGLAAVVRLVIALTVEGYQVDVNCFRSWGYTMCDVGPARFYKSTSFCDYTPGYIYIMGLCNGLSQLGSSLGLSIMPAFYHKLVPMACDLVGAYLITRAARREGRFTGPQAELLGLLVAFSPAMILNSAAWCQIDSVLCLGLLIVALLAVRRQWAALMPVYVLCALIKPQALMLGPLGLLVIIVDLMKHRQVCPMLIGVGISAQVAAAVIVPFSVQQKPGWLIEKYVTTLGSYPYATVNTANFYYIFGGNWASTGLSAGWLPAVCLALLALGWGALCLVRNKRPARIVEPVLMACFAVAFLVMACLGASWGVIGFTAMGLAFAIVLPMYLRSGNLRHVPLLGAVLFILLYVFGAKMHERYLFPALFLLALAFALHRNWRTLLLLAVLTCTLFVNEGIVLDNAIRLGSQLGHLNNDTLGLAVLLALVNILCACLAVWTAQRVCVEQEEKSRHQPGRLEALCQRLRERTAPDVRTFSTDASLHWKRLDWVLMLGVTAVYAALCLCNLGSTKAPQTAWTSTANNEAVIIDLGQPYDDFSMLYFAQVSYSDFSVAVSPDGETWSDEYWAEMAQGQCFRWMYLMPCTVTEAGTRYYTGANDLSGVQRLSGRYVRLTAQQIGLTLDEVIFRDANGSAIPATMVEVRNANQESPLLSDASHLLDEQDTLEGEPSWYNSTYFDEIYHARTAFEHLNGTRPYETSHPPLGKVIMSWFVALFGMTPFGWRFAGALAGILMLPAMYLLGKQLTKRTDMAFAAMTMMALDCMHFTQTRIATIDSFPVLFIILCFLFMLRFMQRDIVMEPVRKLLPDLALCGFFMGCAFASKWIGAYAGIGLAVLFFWTCMRHWRLSKQAEACIRQGKGTAEMKQRSQAVLGRIITLCLWCLLFFVAVPVIIYLLSYIPYFAYAHKDSLWDFISMVWHAGEGMLSYHGTPGLGMDHPFYSPWYEWPLIQRPMYYASARFVPDGYSYAIFCFGNPAVWLAGLAALVAVAFTWAKRHLYRLEGSGSIAHVQASSWSVAPAFVLIGFLAQFLPWVLVPRGTYIYHYFASIPFLVLGTTLVLHWLCQRWPRAGRAVLIVYLLLCLVCFVAFYPYASGVLTPDGWLDFMTRFLHVYHA